VKKLINSILSSEKNEQKENNIFSKEEIKKTYEEFKKFHD
jgi:hypothetical protein